MKTILDIVAYLVVGGAGILLLIGLTRLILLEPKMLIPCAILAAFLWALKRVIDNLAP